MDEAILIRAASLADLAGVGRVATLTWRATYAGQIPDSDIQAFLQSNYNPATLEQTLTRLDEGFLVAVAGDDVVGYVMLSLDRDGFAQLWSIYVLPDYQKRGVGKLLWDAALAHARSNNWERLVLWVLESNQQARRFYERQGATLVEQREFSVGSVPVSEVRYALDLR